MAAKSSESEKKVGLTYWSKDKLNCPVCNKPFAHEIMRSGNGRMIAGSLTPELHRNFEPSAKYGTIYPLIYEVGACPHCNTAFFWNDFHAKISQADKDKLAAGADRRMQMCEKIFPHYNLQKERTLFDGCAMYYLALLSYNDVSPEMIPTLKMAIISLRLAWLTDDLHKCCEDHNYDLISKMFYSKALFFYQQAVLNETERKEKSSTLANMGPDIDKNYGWDGVIYLCGLLEYNYGQQDDLQLRLKKLNESKISIARIFGLGKSSKSKPGPLLTNARELYEKITKLLKDDEF